MKRAPNPRYDWSATLYLDDTSIGQVEIDYEWNADWEGIHALHIAEIRLGKLPVMTFEDHGYTIDARLKAAVGEKTYNLLHAEMVEDAESRVRDVE